MLLNTFEYLKPTSLGEALSVLDELKEKKTQVLAGGTDLIPWLRGRVKDVDYLIDLADTGLDHILFDDDQGQARIGAMVTFTALCEHPEVRRRLPSVAEAALQVGAVQTRNQATIGGNLCSAVPSLDGAPSLLVLGATLRLQTQGSERLIPIEQFFLGPRRTVLQPGEVLTEIVVPLREDFTASFLRMGRRKALTLSIVNVAAGLAMDGQQVSQARIALGAVAPTPIRAYKAEQLLQGRKMAPELFAEAAAVAATEISPISDLRASADYRRKISVVLVRRALEIALARQKKTQTEVRAAGGGV
ncbi:MAG: xanthine dehydrogenase family protein subunit M [Candidatus Korobacteraceae bacterium]|jgi:carbon-monoxide dehydrogenase medium subunit